MKKRFILLPACFFIGLIITFAFCFVRHSNTNSDDIVPENASSTSVLPLTTKSISDSTSQSQSSDRSSPDHVSFVPPEKRYALLIGINNYKDPGIPALMSCVKDMTDLKSVLIKYAKFKPENITLMTDNSKESLFPTAENIRKRVVQLKASIPTDALLMVVFSCHGVMIDLQDGSPIKSCLCAQDTVLTDVDSYIDREWLFKTIDKCPAEKKLLFCDACRSLSTKEQLTEISETTPEGNSIRVMKMDMPSKASWNYNFILMSSCSEGQTSIDAGVNSLFISFLLEYEIIRVWRSW